MRIMQLTSSTGFFGAENVILGLSHGLREHGWDVSVVNLVRPGNDAPLLRRARSLDIAAHQVACRGRFDRRAVSALRRWMTDNRIDIIHSHGYKSDIYALLSRPSPSVSLVTTCHNWLGNSFKMKSYKLIDKALLRRFDRVVVVSESLRRETRRSGIAAEKIVTIHNGIRCDGSELRHDRAAVRAELGMGADVTMVTAVGRLSTEKGYDILLAAIPGVLAAFPHTGFVIAGEGPDRQKLSRQITRAGLDGKVRLAGNRDDILRLLSASDAFVMPSLLEGMPMALLEAMSCGLPIVASRVGEIPRMIDGGVEGILVPPDNAASLRAALIELLGNTRKAGRMGESARRRMMRDFTTEKMLNAYMKVYGEVKGNGGIGE